MEEKKERQMEQSLVVLPPPGRPDDFCLRSDIAFVERSQYSYYSSQSFAGKKSMLVERRCTVPQYEKQQTITGEASQSGEMEKEVTIEKGRGESERAYLAHVPGLGREIEREPVHESMSESPPPDPTLLPLIIAFHGTNETMWDTELLKQKDGGESWLDLSRNEDKPFLYVLAQARCHQARSFETSWRKDVIRTRWRGGANDALYIQAILADMDQWLRSLEFGIDYTRIYLLGFSNGGLMVLDYSLKMGDLFAAACSYMGGMATTQIDDLGLSLQQIQTRVEELVTLKRKGGGDVVEEEAKLQNTVQWPQSQRIPTYLVTATHDPNRSPIYRGWGALSLLGWRTEENLFLLDMPDETHRVVADLTPKLWSFFANNENAQQMDQPTFARKLEAHVAEMISRHRVKQKTIRHHHHQDHDEAEEKEESFFMMFSWLFFAIVPLVVFILLRLFWF